MWLRDCIALAVNCCAKLMVWNRQSTINLLKSGGFGHRVLFAPCHHHLGPKIPIDFFKPRQKRPKLITLERKRKKHTRRTKSWQIFINRFTRPLNNGWRFFKCFSYLPIFAYRQRNIRKCKIKEARKNAH